MGIKLFISGFPLDSSELELVQLVSPYAEVETIKIVRDKVTKKCKGYAFLEVSAESNAEAAIEALNGRTSGDRVLTLTIAEEKPVAQNSLPKYIKAFGTDPTAKKKRPRRIL